MAQIMEFVFAILFSSFVIWNLVLGIWIWYLLLGTCFLELSSWNLEFGICHLELEKCV